MNLKNIAFFILYIIVINISLNISCNVDRSIIGINEKVHLKYNYIHDYQFIRNRFFFVDTYYRDRYEIGFSNDLILWNYEEGTLIREFNVYRSTHYADIEGRDGVATLPSRMEEFDSLESLAPVVDEAGEVEKGTFKKLEEGTDYEYDYARGFFYLNFSIRDTEILAVAYRTDLKTVGTLYSTIDDNNPTQFYILRLIKPKALRNIYTDVWSLTMRNVYHLGAANIVKDGFNVTIRKNVSHEMIQQESPRLSYLHLLGLDLLNENGQIVAGGDRIIDNNPHLVDRFTGILMFPGLQPFDPLPDSRFQLSDTNRVSIYNSTDRSYQISQSKFEIVVQYIDN